MKNSMFLVFRSNAARVMLSGGVRFAGSLFAIATLVAACTALKLDVPESAGAVEGLASPDYKQDSAWLAFPGRDGLERSTPPGIEVVDESVALTDVFFIHPTTYLANDVMNVPYNVTGELNMPVVLGQLSVFNGCCRIYAPNYRQATLKGIPSAEAMTLAYSDVARAFRYYVNNHNDGRPFIIASHSQGTEHAVRLLQAEIIGTPLQNRLVVAYTVGAYTPSTFDTIGLSVCASAQQIGCIASWNTVQEGRKETLGLVRNVKYWWAGERVLSSDPAVCVNPLTWSLDGSVDAGANLGALEFHREPVNSAKKQLAPLVVGLTGARCRDALLEVDISSESSFNDRLSKSIGSYHLNDYGIFYANIRANVSLRINSWFR